MQVLDFLDSWVSWNLVFLFGVFFFLFFFVFSLVISQMVPGFSGEEGGGAQESGICMQMHPPPISFRVKCPPCAYNKLYVLYHSWDTGGLTTYYTYFYHKWQYRKDSTQLVDT